MSTEPQRNYGYYVPSAFFAFIIVGLLVWLWPSLIPFRFWQFWEIHGSLSAAVWNAWPFYVWGVAVVLISLFFFHDGLDELEGGPIHYLMAGGMKSLWAGVAEEITFRWLFFFSAILIASVLDFLLLGFMGIHLVRWLYEYVLFPVANFFTLGYLKGYLLGGYGWAVGAAIISSNGDFRNGHRYQGLFGFVNSWFLGMYFFWVMFTYGLVASMAIHFCYNFAIYVSLAVLSLFSRRRRWA